MDRLKAKLGRWRAAFQPVKARVDALEREVTDLEAKAARGSAVGSTGGQPIRDIGRREAGAGEHREPGAE